MKVTSIVLFVLISTGCTPLLPKAPPPKTLFVLADTSCEDKVDDRGATILVSAIESSAFLDSPRIVFSTAPDVRADYQQAAWVESLPDAVEHSVIRRLKCEGAFRGVEDRNTTVRADYQLNIRLIDFYHDAVTVPGLVKLQASAEFVDVTSRTLASRTSFDIQEKVSTVENKDVVDAFQKANRRFLDELSVWIRSAMPPASEGNQTR